MRVAVARFVVACSARYQLPVNLTESRPPAPWRSAPATWHDAGDDLPSTKATGTGMAHGHIDTSTHRHIAASVAVFGSSMTALACGFPEPASPFPRDLGACMRTSEHHGHRPNTKRQALARGSRTGLGP